MPTTTTNLGLTKPDLVDAAAIGVLNANADLLDQKWNPASPASLAPGNAASAGAQLTISRSDHVHGLPGFGTPVAVGSLNQEGTSPNFARADHVHAGGSTLSGALQHGPETFDLELDTLEDVRVYLPGTPTNVTLVLRGRLPRAGLLAAHSHPVGSLAASNEAAHTHSGPSHTHGDGTLAADSGGLHGHELLTNRADSGLETGPTNDQGYRPYYVQATDAQSAHSHTVSGETAAAGTGATGPASAHSHTLSGSTAASGSGGYTSAQRPSGVQVVINGVDRTAALGGAFGVSNADWDQQNLDVLPYIATSGWHTIEVKAVTTPGRLKVQVLAGF